MSGVVGRLSISEFSQIRRRWDRRENCVIATILPGELYATREDELVSTVLGSCVAACVRDKVTGVGGMNHFMLPATSDELSQGGKEVTSQANRYGNYAMEHLINTILSNGGRRENLEVKLFGGGKMISLMSDIGGRNIEFVRRYMKMEGLALVGEDLGDVFPRKVLFNPFTGRARVKKLRNMHKESVVNNEINYRDQIKVEPVESDIELF
ncbi:MAG: chemoreceptor glutamine deamidase CheD [Gammaproteobacteria bacterium]|nr:MAG: chemoreceptor glutamine deamidase CheD [Gammaproteobacteria bacterium]